jgi:hypothetical protein
MTPTASLVINNCASCWYVLADFFFSAELSLELRLYSFSHSTSPFLGRVFFQYRVSQTFYPG